MKYCTFMVCFLSFFHLYADTISVRADEWCPYNCAPGDKTPGFMLEIATAILEKAGHKIDYKIQPWNSAVEDCLAGKINAIIGASTSDSDQLIFGEEGQGFGGFCFFAKSDSDLTYDNFMSKIKLKKLAIIDGYGYGPKIDSYVKKNKENPNLIISTTGDNALKVNINKLMKSEVDLIVSDPNVAEYYSINMGLKGKIKKIGCEEDNQLFLAFSPKNPKSKEYAKLMTDGVRQMRKDGSLKAILDKYNLKDWK